MLHEKADYQKANKRQKHDKYKNTKEQRNKGTKEQKPNKPTKCLVYCTAKLEIAHASKENTRHIPSILFASANKLSPNPFDQPDKNVSRSYQRGKGYSPDAI
jgi:hypothetical protein